MPQITHAMDVMCTGRRPVAEADQVLGWLIARFTAWLAAFALLLAAPLQAQSQTVSTFNLPLPDSQPYGITLGPDGNMWLTESAFGATRVGRIDSAGRISEIFVPSRTSQGHITSAPDGVWFVEPGGFPFSIGRVTPAGVMTEFGLNLNTCGPCSLTPYGIVRGPDGNIWFTEWVQNAIVKLDVATGVFTYFSIFALGFGATGITVGPDNALWFAINSTNPAIGRLDPVTGAITTFVSPLVTDPLEITLGPDGNLWFTQPRDNSVNRITPQGVITRFALPTAASSPQRIVTGPDGALWVTLHGINRVGRIATAGVITEPVQVAGGPWGLARGNGNEMWITLKEGNQIGRFTVGAAAAPVLNSLSVSPSSLVGGNPSSGSVVLSGAAPAGGAVVTLSDTSSAVSVPGSVTVPAGATSASFNVSTVAVTAATTASVSASYAGEVRTAALTVNPASTTPPVPLAPALIAPAAGATVAHPVSFDWSDVAHAVSYEIQVASSSAFTAPLLASQFGNASQAMVQSLPTQSLWWRVRALNAAGAASPFSAARGFTPQGVSPPGPPPANVSLTVSASGRSGERVSSSPAGIDVIVGSSGSASFAAGTAITLSIAGGRSAVWSGACSSGGSKTRSCAFKINAAASVTANVQ